MDKNWLADEIRNLLAMWSDGPVGQMGLANFDLDSYVEKLLSNAVVLVHIEESSIRGIIAFYCNNPNREFAFITQLCVDPQSRRRGIAKSLVLQSITCASLRGFREMRLEVNENNAAAVKLYASLGFSDAGARRHQCVTMSKPLT
jgi:ribosomal protein S18 acetylase RimI-like enzyme